jgi:hypothetical protein
VNDILERKTAFNRRLPYIERFGLRANGNAPPLSRLHTPPANGQALGGIITASDHTLYVAGFANPAIIQYAAKARDHDAPITVISGPNTQLVLPTFVYVR